MTDAIHAAFRAEMDRGRAADARCDWSSAIHHFERAHILGQRRTVLHVHAHVALLGVAWRRRDVRELVGQVMRVIAAALFSRVWVPVGNTGGANVSAFQPMPVPDDLRALLATESRHAPQDRG